jgi:hypothetical protein
MEDDKCNGKEAPFQPIQIEETGLSCPKSPSKGEGKYKLEK